MNPLAQALQHELERRVAGNPRYSLRSFAKFLGIPPSTLSNFLGGRVGLSPLRAQAIVNKLALPSKSKMALVLAAEAAFARGAKRKQSAQRKLDRLTTKTELEFVKIEAERFYVVSAWEHFAILEYLSLTCPPATVEQLSDAMRITTHRTIAALERLRSVGLLTTTNHLKIEPSTSTACMRPQDTSTAVMPQAPSSAVRVHHKQVMRLAHSAIDEDPLSSREMATLTFALSSQSIGAFKQRLVEIQKEFSTTQASTQPKDKVYFLAMQFFEAKEALHTSYIR